MGERQSRFYWRLDIQSQQMQGPSQAGQVRQLSQSQFGKEKSTNYISIQVFNQSISQQNIFLPKERSQQQALPTEEEEAPLMKQDLISQISVISNKSVPLKQQTHSAREGQPKVYAQVGFPIDLVELKNMKKPQAMLDLSQQRQNLLNRIQEQIDFSRNKSKELQNLIEENRQLSNSLSQGKVNPGDSDFHVQCVNSKTPPKFNSQMTQLQNLQNKTVSKQLLKDFDQHKNLLTPSQASQHVLPLPSFNNSPYLSKATPTLSPLSQHRPSKSPPPQGKVYYTRKDIRQPPQPKKLKIQQFELLQELGSGRYGKVHLVRQRETGFVMAMKIISVETIEETNVWSQLQQEIRIQQGLVHANIIQLYGWFKDLVNVYILLEYAAGGDLYHRLFSSPNSKLPENVVKQYIGQFAQVLDFLKRAGVMHRDIKPENILLANGQIKLADFGWSTWKAMAAHQEQEQTFCGTADYVSPEMLDRQHYDFKVDVWSLGVLTFELLSGTAPFNQSETQDQDTIFSNIRLQDTQTMSFPESLSGSAVDFIRWVLNKDPAARPSARQVLNHPWLRQGQAQEGRAGRLRAIQAQMTSLL